MATVMTKTNRCDNCPYGPGPAAGPRGPIDAPLVIVGEAPGRDELRTGVPFTGPSGKLLHKTAESVGLDISEAYFTNALRCQPPAADSPPKQSLLQCCQERLYDELSHTPRQLLLLMGNSAVRSVTGNGSAKITQVRGKVIDTDFGPALPILHPAAILRNAGDYVYFLQDFQYASDIINSNGSMIKKLEQPQYVVLSSSDLEQVLARLLLETYLAMDIETSGFNWGKDDILCIGIRTPGSETYIVPQELCTKDYLERFFTNCRGQLVWHNGKFDTQFLKAQLDIDVPVDEDTMLLSYCLDERPQGHSLKQLSEERLGAPDYESILKQYAPKKTDSYANVPKGILHQYLAYDVACTDGLYEQLGPSVRDDSALRQLYERVLIPASAFLREVETAGLPVNREYLDDLEETLLQRHIDLQHTILEAAEEYWDVDAYCDATGASMPKSGKFNPGSPKQLQWLLYDKMGLRPPPKFPRNTAEATLTRLPDNPITPLILENRGVEKRLSTYVHGIQDLLEESHDGRLHPTFLLHGTVTGRLSSRGPNAQNFPREALIKNIIQAPPGRRFLEADYSQAELRCLAWLAQDEFLMDVYAQGLDLHDEVAEDFHPGWKHEEDPIKKREQRIRAKFVNFGIAYGRGASSISKEFGIPIPVAQEYIDRWMRRASGAAAYLAHCRQTALRGGTLISPFGRKRRFGLVTPDNQFNAQNEASNFAIQSMASDLTLISAMRMQQAFDPGIKVINLVHDSILVEVPDDDAIVQETSEMIIDIMQSTPEKVLGVNVPFDADVKSGFRWGDLGE